MDTKLFRTEIRIENLELELLGSAIYIDGLFQNAKTLIQGNEEGLDDYVETALDQHTLLERTTVSLCMTHNPGGYERITIGWFTYHTALMLVLCSCRLELGRWLTPAVIRDDQVCRRWTRETEVFL